MVKEMPVYYCSAFHICKENDFVWAHKCRNRKEVEIQEQPKCAEREIYLSAIHNEYLFY